MVVAELCHQFRTCVGCRYYQSSCLKLLRGLFQQVYSVDNEIELRHHAVLGIVIRENVCKIVGQSRLPTTLCMPYNTRRGTLIELVANSQRRKHLLIAHDVLLVSTFNFAVHFLFHLHIGNAILYEEQQTFGAAHGGKYSVGWCIHIQVCLIFRRMMDYLTVEIRQYAFLFILLDAFVRIFFYKWRNRLIRRIFFTEAVERSTFSCSRAIEGALYWYNASHCIILHIVGEYHQLSDIDEPTEFFVRKAFPIHSLALCHHAAMIIRLLYLNKAKWQAIDKQRYVRAKLVLTIFTSKLGGEMERVVPRIIKVYQSYR